jgi:CubicO group peptidase (beta-lactamase class C family)
MPKTIPGLPRRRVLLAGAASLVASAGAVRAAPWPPTQAAGLPALDAALESAAAVQALRAVAVARDGQLVAERFYAGGTTDTLFRINSVTKSVSSMLVGIALAQGKLSGLSQTLGELLPDAAAAQPASPASAVTLRQVLTGTTGLAFDWLKEFRSFGGSRDPVQYAFALGKDDRPPGSWSYNDAAIGLLSPILERAYGMPLPEVARRHLFTPLGIDRFEWQRDRSGRAMAFAGLQLPVQGLLKLAWLAADGGRWQGTQVVPADWMGQSTQRHVASFWRNPPLSDECGYGYLWFTGAYKGVPVAWGWGLGAQFAVAVPSLRLAVATNASEPPPQQLPAQNRDVAGVVARILDALM